MTRDEGGEPLDWLALVPFLIHPTKVTVIEAMRWIDQPLSASDLTNVFNSELSLPRVSYHLKMLAKAGVLVKVRERKARGATEKFYYFSKLIPGDKEERGAA